MENWVQARCDTEIMEVIEEITFFINPSLNPIFSKVALSISFIFFVVMFHWFHCLKMIMKQYQEYYYYKQT